MNAVTPLAPPPFWTVDGDTVVSRAGHRLEAYAAGVILAAYDSILAVAGDPAASDLTDEDRRDVRLQRETLLAAMIAQGWIDA